MFDQETGHAVHARIAGDIDDLPPPPWRLIGEGLWGEVHDLGDGTVLKLIRRHAGLGTGTSKLAREAAALKLAGGLAIGGLRIPNYRGHGHWDNPFAFGGSYNGPPLAGWIRMERMEGRARAETTFYGRMAEEGSRFGEELGAAIAAFHRETVACVPEAAKLGDSLMRSLEEALSRISSAEQRRRLDILRARWGASGGAPVFVHGDLNLSNVLGGPGGLAFVDFAEAGIGAPETDLRHFENTGPLRDAIFRGYAAVAGRMPDLERYRMAVAVDAAVSLAIGGDSGHPREGLRRRQWLDEALRQAGID